MPFVPPIPAYVTQRVVLLLKGPQDDAKIRQLNTDLKKVLRRYHATFKKGVTSRRARATRAEPRLHVHLAEEPVGGGEVPLRRRLIRALRQGASERAMAVRHQRTHPETLGHGERLSGMLQCPSRIRSILREQTKRPAFVAWLGVSSGELDGLLGMLPRLLVSSHEQADLAEVRQQQRVPAHE